MPIQNSAADLIKNQSINRGRGSKSGPGPGPGPGSGPAPQLSSLTLKNYTSKKPKSKKPPAYQFRVEADNTLNVLDVQDFDPGLSESQLQQGIENCLVYEFDAIVTRLNSGTAFDKTGKRRIRLATKGTTDLVAALPYGLTVWIEVKTTKGRVSKNQEIMHERLNRIGHYVIVARSIDQIREYVRDLIAKHKKGGPFGPPDTQY